MFLGLTSASDSIRTPLLKNNKLKIIAGIFLIYWLSTLIGTSNFVNWIMENTLVILFIVFLLAVRKKFIFSELSYVLIFIYLSLHIYGSKYTYAENPFGYWLKDVLHSERNHYDRIVHFSFGFLMAYPLRDYFKNYFGFPNWVCWVLPVEITISFSAIYELIEWAVADVFFPAQGLDYLGSQGDIWDAQKDMALASFGAVLIMIIAWLMKKIVQGNKSSALKA
jgi:putative membrane protein